MPSCHTAEVLTAAFAEQWLAARLQSGSKAAGQGLLLGGQCTVAANLVPLLTHRFCLSPPAFSPPRTSLAAHVASHSALATPAGHATSNDMPADEIAELQAASCLADQVSTGKIQSYSGETESKWFSEINSVLLHPLKEAEDMGLVIFTQDELWNRGERRPGLKNPEPDLALGWHSPRKMPHPSRPRRLQHCRGLQRVDSSIAQQSGRISYTRQ